MLSEPFLVLPENRFAYTAITATASVKAGKAPVPVFLHGPSGTGKSHLAWHAVQLLVRSRKEARFRNVQAGEFAAEFAEASQSRTISEFQSAGGPCELFILEDLQALEGRPETQRQLLSLVDDLAARGCQWIWTCRKSPGELNDMLPKLVNRFHAGVTALVRLPSAASRSLLLEHFAKSRQAPLSPQGIQLLADALPVSPRELLAVVLQLEAHAIRKKCAIDTPFVKQFLRLEVPPPGIALGDISRAVALQFGIPAAELRSRARVQGLILPRQCAMFLCRELTGKGLEQIGQYFGDRDHSTVLHACKRLKQILPGDPTVRLRLSQIRSALGVNDPG